MKKSKLYQFLMALTACLICAVVLLLIVCLHVLVYLIFGRDVLFVVLISTIPLAWFSASLRITAAICDLRNLL